MVLLEVLQLIPKLTRYLAKFICESDYEIPLDRRSEVFVYSLVEFDFIK